MAHLIIMLTDSERPIELAEHNTIGRDPQNRIRFADPSVSKEHAVISIDRNRECTIQDLASTNGTFVNGKRISDPTTLHDGDSIKLGSICSRFKGEEKSASQMVEMNEEEDFLQTLTFSPLQDRFLPEKNIRDEKSLRLDYEKLRVTYELQHDLRLDTDVKTVLDKILDRTSEFLKYDQAVILLANRDGKMIPKSYRDVKKKDRLIISSTLIEYVKTEKTGVISTNVQTDGRFNIADSIILQGVKSTLAAPILSNEDILGIMILSSLEETNAFTEKDLGLITSIAHQTAQIIKNSLLHDELKLSFESSIRTLSAMVDARHPLTAGHSERVTDYSLFIAKEMGLSENEMENLKFASLLHDIGKIGIRDKILLKNGKFTPDERNIMNTHPEKTKKILNNFHFPNSLRDVPEYAGHHHEKVNGRGYPNALIGEQLPLISKIMAVADVFDALTDKRDYPKYISGRIVSYDPLPIAEVVALFRNEAGSHFDPEVVTAFIRCLPRMLSYYKGVHFKPEYVEEAIGLVNDSKGNPH